MQRNELEYWLRERDSRQLDELWQQADAVRRAHVGDEVHLRGLLEISNICARQCHYCGLRAPNSRLKRYRMSSDEILAAARLADRLGYGTIVLQAGEDPGLYASAVADLVRQIRIQTPLAVTLSLGERLPAEWALWREAGADRCLLRFETADRALYDRIHPRRNGAGFDRVAQLRELRRLGYEVGSGIMIGLPGQGLDDLVQALALFAELDLDMIGVGPYVPHPDTPLASDAAARLPDPEQLTYKVMALARLVCPGANIPSTTALATVNRESGRVLGLQRGANVIMPNLTPPPYRKHYAIYPGKACTFEDVTAYDALIKRQIEGIGRCLGCGRGDSPNWIRRQVSATAPVASVRGESTSSRSLADMENRPTGFN